MIKTDLWGFVVAMYSGFANSSTNPEVWELDFLFAGTLVHFDNKPLQNWFICIRLNKIVQRYSLSIIAMFRKQIIIGSNATLLKNMY